VAQENAAPKLDRYGDPLPEGAIARLGTMRLRAHGWCVTFSADGKLMAQGTSNFNARIWETATGREIVRFQGNKLGQVWRVALSPDSKTLATLDSDNGLLLWDAQTGKFRCGSNQKLKERNLLPGRAFSFSADSETFYAALGGELEAVRVRDGQLIDPHAPPQKDLSTSAFSPDCTFALSLAKDGRLVVWNLVTGKVFGEVAGPETRGLVALSAGGKRIAVATTGDRPDVVVYDAVTKKEVCRCTGHMADVSAISFAPDGKSLVTGSNDLTARLWDAETGKERWVYRGDTATFYWVSAVFNPDGRTVALAGWDGNPRILYANTGKESVETGREYGVYPLAITPDGKGAYASGLGGSICRWDLETGEVLSVVKGARQDTYDPAKKRVVHAGDFINRLDVLPDGKRLAVTRSHGLRLWDVSDPESARAGEEIARTIFASISADGNRVATLGKEIQILDIATKKVLRTVGNPGVGGDLLFSPDGRSLAVAGQESTVYLFDARTLKLRATMRNGGVQQVGSMTFTPDGQLLASGGLDWQVNIWEVATGKLRRGVARPRSMSSVVAFSPDGRFLAYGGMDKSVTVFDLVADHVAHTFRGHDGHVTSLAFTPNVRRLISSSGDGTALVWDMGAVPVRAPAVFQRTQKELDAIWVKLSGRDAAEAAAAMADLVKTPVQAVELIGAALKPVKKDTATLIADLVHDLGSDVFGEREKASARLAELGEVAEPALLSAVNHSPSPEIRARAAVLLGKLEGRGLSAERLRAIRSVQVLEWIGTPAALKVLEALADGGPGAELTQQSAAAVTRLKAR